MKKNFRPIMAQTRETQIAEYAQFLAFLNDNTDDYLFLLDFTGAKIYFARDIADCYALDEQPEGGYLLQDWMNIVHTRDSLTLSHELNELQSGSKTVHNLDYRIMECGGDFVWVSCKGNIIQDEHGHPAIMIGCLSDTALADQIDPLTGLLNISKLLPGLTQSLQGGDSGILMFFDIDDFKTINAKYGRGFGYTLLYRIARLLEEYTDSKFQIYRTDEDHFVVNLAQGNRRHATVLYENIQKHMPEGCTISAGAAEYPEPTAQTANILLTYAENAVDMAKQEGKNRLCFFSLEQYEKQLYILDLTEEIRRSVQNNLKGFSLLYQPLVATDTCEVVGAEALVRYHSTVHGIVAPDVFVHILEQTDMMLPVGNWILKEAIFQCRKWRLQRPDFVVNINLSYAQLQHREMSDHLFSLLRQADLPDSAITLELTESMHLQNYTCLRRLFIPHDGEGIHIAIDDFGSGYSSLQYLQDLSVDAIKIDRCLVSHIHLSAYNYHLLQNILELARKARICVCCEGVESADELRTLRQMKPDLLQGYYFSKPLPPEQFEKLFILGHEKEALWASEIKADSYAPESPESSAIKDSDYKAILDQLEEVVYLSDMESYELYYMNRAGQRMTGVTDYQGKKCYKVLQGKNDPCDFCTNDDLQMNSFLTYTSSNQYLNHRLLEKCKLFHWNGKNVRLEVESNMAVIDSLLEDMETKLSVEEALVQMLFELSTLQDAHFAIQKLLRHTGTFYQAERCYICLRSPEENCWSNLYEWCQHEVERQQLSLLSIPDEWLRPWTNDFAQGKTLVIKDLDLYKDEQSPLWSILENKKISRMLVSPIMNGETVFGFIGVDNPKHLPYNEEFLVQGARTAANLFAQNEMLIVKKERLAEMTSMLKDEDILKSTGLGLWIIEIDSSQGICRMFVDENMNNIMGVEGSLNSVEYYRHWYENINDGYYNYVDNALKEMISSGNTISLEYTWNHPKRGEVAIQCVGCLSKAAGEVYTLKGYHRIVDDVIQKRFIDDENYEMFEYNEMRHSIYFHTARTLLAGDHLKESDFPNCWVEQNIVHSYFISDFKKLLTFVKDYTEKQSLDLLLRNKDDEFEWFRMETHRIGHTEQDINTLIISLHPIMDNQPAQMQYIRKDDYYHAMLSETVAYMELDLDSELIQNSGGLWGGYASEVQDNAITFRALVYKYAHMVVSPEDVDTYVHFLNPDVMCQSFKDGQTTTTYQFRRNMGDASYHWLELSIHVFQEQVTQNMYALLYLKDIDTHKRRQLEQEKAASRDPLTNVLNRKAMKDSVIEYMNTQANDEDTYALMIFDLDNFKQINDTQGHQMGDAALKIFVATLKDTFRTSDFIGRLGGDEFLVFVTRQLSRETLDRRLTRMQEKLHHNKVISLSCSIGIHLLHKDGFDYDESLKKSDTALYTSKDRGKGIHSYYRDPS
ncbi:MAG: EAL domain-containing protein [Firmicutes bacterium]|nr:EAL domain-containing protein [Bacillota bacterium]